MATSASMFGIAAAGLVLLTLALVLRPLWRANPVPAIAGIVVLALMTAGLYHMVGTPAALRPAALQAPATLPDAILQLEAELQRNPRQVEGWRLLGRAYADAREPTKARDAYGHAARLAPADADILAEAAEARALAAPQRIFDTQAIAMLQQALQLQPQHQRARWFLGIAQRQAGKPADAAATWQPLLAQVDGKTAAPLRGQIDAARIEAGLQPLPETASEPTAPAPLQVTVRLDPGLAASARLASQAVVFVIARAPEGPPMPLAVEKHRVRELPFTASLDDGDGPMPTRRLSSVREVEVIARLSLDGTAVPRAGDLESRPVRVTLPAPAPLVLTIDHVRP